MVNKIIKPLKKINERAWQRMLSGRKLDILSPSPLDIEIEDIALGLSRVTRWNGQTTGKHPYSVAQHSLLVEELFNIEYPEINKKWNLAALLHDAPEYVIGDLITPFKYALNNSYRFVEDTLMKAIFLRFGLPAILPKHIESKIKKCTLVAPFDGVIDSPLVSVNDFVQVGTPLVKIISKISSSIHVPVNILNSDIYKIGTNVIFNFKQKQYDLVVNDIKPSLNSDNSLTLVVKLPKNVFIPAGKNVKIKIFKAKIINAIFIPEESIVQRPNGKVVYILNEDIVNERKIETGVSSSLQTEIISGLEGDESIILEGAGFLTDGARVKVKIENN